jgi:hypothetical protein
MAAAPLLGLLAVCGATLSACGDQNGPTAPARGQRVLPAAGFAVLREPRAAGDALPSELVAALQASQRPDFSRADIDASRRVLADTPAWLLTAANGEACLARLNYPLLASVRGTALPPIPSSTCMPAAQARLGALVDTQSLASEPGPRARSARSKVLGVAPDGVHSVTVLSSGGRSVRVPVSRNAYEALVARPASVHFTIHAGGRRVVHSVALSTFSSHDAGPQPNSAGAAAAG